jgi:putative transcriptional regulator
MAAVIRLENRRATWEPVEPRADWARVDATTEAEIERHTAFDDGEAAKDVAA